MPVSQLYRRWCWEPTPIRSNAWVVGPASHSAKTGRWRYDVGVSNAIIRPAAPQWFTPQAENSYLWELNCQLQAIRISLDSLRQGLAKDALDMDALVASSLLFLGATAAISKILWPIEKGTQGDATKKLVEREKKMRGRYLREVLSVPEDSPFKSRDVRNGFEHFDESLDAFFRSGKTNIVDRFVGPPTAFNFSSNEIEGRPETGWAIFRGIDSSTGIISILNDKIDSHVIARASEALMASVAARRAVLAQA